LNKTDSPDSGLTDKQVKFSTTKIKEKIVHFLLFMSSVVPIFTTFGIVFTLLFETISFFGKVSIVEFLTGTQWTPLFIPQHFGILPLLSGTFLVTLGAMIVAIPLGLGAAIYLSEYASNKSRLILKPFLEILAGIPTVVYGYAALLIITPILRKFFPQTNIFNAASASIAVGIMIIPMIASLSEDALSAVPKYFRDGAYALGAHKYEVTTKVVVPAAYSGIIASFFLALSRAIGETMIVVIAAGSTPNLTLNPLESIQTITGYIVQVSLGDTPFGSLIFQTIFAAGMLLFVLTMAINIVANQIIRSKWKSY
jgi:phosphate transport system permease protein